MPQAKQPQPKATPAFGAVAPPKRTRKGGFAVDPATAQALYDALGAAEGEGWVGDNTAYQSMGKAQAASQRFRKALIDAKLIETVKRVASRVWADGDNHYFALRLRSDDEVTKLGSDAPAE